MTVVSGVMRQARAPVDRREPRSDPPETVVNRRVTGVDRRGSDGGPSTTGVRMGDSCRCQGICVLYRAKSQGLRVGSIPSISTAASRGF